MSRTAVLQLVDIVWMWLLSQAVRVMTVSAGDSVTQQSPRETDQDFVCNRG